MADETASKLFLDAAQVLQTLTALNKAFEQYGKTLQSFATTGAVFNQSQAGLEAGAKKNADALDKQKVAAENALKVLQQLQSVKPADFSTATPAQIARVNSAIASFQNIAQKSKLTLQELQNIVNNLGGAYTGMSAKVAAAANRYVAAVKGMEDGTRGLVTRATIGLGTLAKVAAVQALQRQLSALTGELRESVEEARKYELQLAGIQTISTELATSGIDNLSTSAANLANEFGKPLGDVSKGLYETISNQVGDASESFSFLTDSLRFGRAAITSTANSVDLLSGVLNSYQLRSTSAARVSDVLFKTIDIGRTTADALHDTFGRVLPLASQLGVRFEEVGASVATLTNKGITTDEALTQMLNVMVQLLKPSVELQASFDELGVSGANAGIAAFGLQGFLQRLLGTTNGTSEAMAELFRNSRALRGVLAQTGDSADFYAKALKEIDENSAGATKAADDLVAATDAAKFTKNINTIKNTFVEGFGRDSLKAINDLIEGLGGVDVQAKGLSNTASILFTGFTRLASVLARPFIAAGAAIAPLLPQLREVDGLANEAIDKLTRAREDDVKSAIAAQQDIVRAQRTAIEQQVSAVEQQFFRYQQLYNKDEAAAIAEQQKVSASFKDQLAERLSAVSQLNTKLQQIQDNSIKNQKKAAQDTLDLDFRINQGKFNRSLEGKDDAGTSAALIARSNKLLAASKDALRKGNEAFATKLFENAVDLADQAANITGKRAAGEAQLNKLLQEQKTLQEGIGQIEGKKAATAKEAQTKLREQEESLKRSAQDFNDAQEAIAKGKGKLTEAELDGLEAKARTAAKSFEKTLSEISIDKSIDFDISKFNRPFTSPITGKPVPLEFATTEAINKLKETLKSTLIQIPVELQLKTKELIGVDLSKIGGLAEAQSKLSELGKTLAKSLAEAGEQVTRLQSKVNGALPNIDVRIQQSKINFENLNKELRNPFGPSSTVPFQKSATDLQNLQERFEGIANAAKRALKSGDITQFKTVQKSLQDFQKTIATPKAGFEGLNFDQLKLTAKGLSEQLKASEQDAEALAKALALQKEGEAALKALAEQAALIDKLIKDANTSLGGTGTAAQEGANGANPALNSIGASAAAAEAQVQSLLQKLQAAAQLSASTAITEATGGYVRNKARYFADGGPVGTDTVPAWLSPNEFVVSEKGTSKFFSQLVAMNRGETPSFGAGNVDQSSTTNVGDVHLHIDGSSGIDGVKLAKVFQRAIRRGVVRR